MNGNISADPRYFNEAGGQYELHPGSPAEDAGTSAGVLRRPTSSATHPSRTRTSRAAATARVSISARSGSSRPPRPTSTWPPPPSAGRRPDWKTNRLLSTAPSRAWAAEAATGSWHDAVYLSASPILTPDAVLLGEVQHTGDLGPGQSYNASGTFTLPGVTPGNYYFLVRCNAENEVFEGANLANNTAAGTATVAMGLPALTLDTPLAGQLAATGAGELYQVTTAAGSDLDVALTGPGGNTNELYVSFGAAGVVAGRNGRDGQGPHVS